VDGKRGKLEADRTFWEKIKTTRRSAGIEIPDCNSAKKTKGSARGKEHTTETM